MTDSLKALERKQSDELAAMRTADTLCNLLRKYIPDACYREAWTKLVDACLEHGLELTDAAMRKQYEAWRSTQIAIAGMRLEPNPPADWQA